MSVVCCEVSHPTCRAFLGESLLLARMPQRGKDVLHCQSVHRVGGDHMTVVLQRKQGVIMSCRTMHTYICRPHVGQQSYLQCLLHFKEGDGMRSCCWWDPQSLISHILSLYQAVQQLRRWATARGRGEGIRLTAHKQLPPASHHVMPTFRAHLSCTGSLWAAILPSTGIFP